MPAAPQETLQEDGAGSAAPQALSGGPGSEATRAATAGLLGQGPEEAAVAAILSKLVHECK
eukprot:CAMPEP_0171584194 /NCGR_PEP_ID=MMETSP0961-20121227/11259_1 /TAXON_ID=87120 /ORGANISM="Aurantiochytrium limacinum, Strain ATCCMYA-1381" /LENGTH=60 /DNA_ID=CAMNT_0012141557 /DNA_START=556 /DNA_END=737 /DNA_ORIENTATION=-